MRTSGFFLSASRAWSNKPRKLGALLLLMVMLSQPGNTRAEAAPQRSSTYFQKVKNLYKLMDFLQFKHRKQTKKEREILFSCAFNGGQPALSTERKSIPGKATLTVPRIIQPAPSFASLFSKNEAIAQFSFNHVAVPVQLCSYDARPKENKRVNKVKPHAEITYSRIKRETPDPEREIVSRENRNNRDDTNLRSYQVAMVENLVSQDKQELGFNYQPLQRGIETIGSSFESVDRITHKKKTTPTSSSKFRSLNKLNSPTKNPTLLFSDLSLTSEKLYDNWKWKKNTAATKLVSLNEPEEIKPQVISQDSFYQKRQQPLENRQYHGFTDGRFSNRIEQQEMSAPEFSAPPEMMIFSQGENMTLYCKNVGLRELLEKITSEARLRLVFERQMANSPVSLNVSDSTTHEILLSLAQSGSFNFSRRQNTIIIY